MIEYLLVVVGLALLYKGADYLVEGSSSLAKRFGVPSLVIGLTIVAFGTSMPELIVNLFASFQGSAGVSYGNIVGSNLLNTLLILGIAAAMAPLYIQISTVWKEIPFAFLAAIVLFVASNKPLLNGSASSILTRADGIILLLFFAIYLYYIFELMKNKNNQQDKENNSIAKHSSLAISFMIIGGLIALFFGGKFTVDGAIAIARQLGISELLISATIVAGGTSLPELATSVIAAIKKEMDLSVGNIVGSNIFNIFLVMGASALISPLIVPAGINFDFLALITATALLFMFMFIGSKHKLDRWQGIAFVLLYLAYLVFIINRG